MHTRRQHLLVQEKQSKDVVPPHRMNASYRPPLAPIEKQSSASPIGRPEKVINKALIRLDKGKKATKRDLQHVDEESKVGESTVKVARKSAPHGQADVGSGGLAKGVVRGQQVVHYQNAEYDDQVEIEEEKVGGGRARKPTSGGFFKGVVKGQRIASHQNAEHNHQVGIEKEKAGGACKHLTGGIVKNVVKANCSSSQQIASHQNEEYDDQVEIEEEKVGGGRARKPTSNGLAKGVVKGQRIASHQNEKYDDQVEIEEEKVGGGRARKPTSVGLAKGVVKGQRIASHQNEKDNDQVEIEEEKVGGGRARKPTSNGLAKGVVRGQQVVHYQNAEDNDQVEIEEEKVGGGRVRKPTSDGLAKGVVRGQQVVHYQNAEHKHQVGIEKEKAGGARKHLTGGIVKNVVKANCSSSQQIASHQNEEDDEQVEIENNDDATKENVQDIETKQPITRNKKWNPIAGAQMFYRSSLGCMRTYEECQVAREKLKKNRREIDSQELFNMAGTLQNESPDLAQAYSTMGFIAELFNVEMNRTHRRASECQNIDVSGFFNVDLCDKKITFETPNGIVINIFRAVRSSIGGYLEKKLDEFFKAVCADVMDEIFKHDPCAAAYSFPFGKKCKYIYANDCNIPTAVADFVLSGYSLELEDDQIQLLLCRLENSARETFENYICRARKVYDGANGPGAALMLAYRFNGKVVIEPDGKIIVISPSVKLPSTYQIISTHEKEELVGEKERSGHYFEEEENVWEANDDAVDEDALPEEDDDDAERE